MAERVGARRFLDDAVSSAGTVSRQRLSLYLSTRDSFHLKLSPIISVGLNSATSETAACR